jgi:hypothetical protein
VNPPRAGLNHPRGVRTEYNQRLAHQRPPGGVAPPTHVRGGGAEFGVQERGVNPSGRARARRDGPLAHHAGERS